MQREMVEDFLIFASVSGITLLILLLANRLLEGKWVVGMVFKTWITLIVLALLVLLVALLFNI